ncbi:MAG: fluoride efflux transporter FluC [Planctomycetaceae bacterium]
MHHPGYVLLLAAAGAIGTLLRAGCTLLTDRLLGHAFPWGTLAVNVLGSFAFGAIYALTRSRGWLTGPQEVIVLVGLLGGFTTCSSFAFQAVEMLAHDRVAAGLAYVAATNIAALAAAWAGLRMFGQP